MTSDVQSLAPGVFVEGDLNTLENLGSKKHPQHSTTHSAIQLVVGMWELHEGHNLA